MFSFKLIIQKQKKEKKTMKSVALFVCLSLLVLATSSPVEIKSLNEKGYTSKPHALVLLLFILPML